MEVRDRMLEREFITPDDMKGPEAKRTVFVIKGLTYDTQVRLQSSIVPTMVLPPGAMGKGEKAWENAMEETSVEMKLSGNTALQFEILDEGLVDVKNLIDGTTKKVIPFPKAAPNMSDKIKKEWFASWMPDDVRVVVANEIQKGSILDEDSLKNS